MALIAVSAIVLAQENPLPRENVREESGLAATHVAPAPERDLPGGDKAPPRIEIALLLDTSNSMDGLIGQAKTQLWKVVNEFIPARRDGRQPELRVALFEYGNSGLPASEGHIRLVTPLTDDLDKVSEELFALTTNGGSEYCGQVIQVATNCLDWSASSDDLKVIFIAGNEPFTQGQVDYRAACRAAISKGIVINTIFCGRGAEG
ncbi:MAG: VWA domain-containing protein, partial [Planctomycetes bacterium]|nr:VWA domain-containing protein [Planctomycetota bacterium]